MRGLVALAALAAGCNSFLGVEDVTLGADAGGVIDAGDEPDASTDASVDAGGTLVTYGFADPFTSSTQVFADELIGYKVTVPSEDGIVHLREIGIVALGTGAKMAIYGDSSDRPAELRASTAPKALDADGTTEFSTLDVALEPGDYWVMAAFDATTQLTMSESSFARLCSLSHPFSTNFPDPIDSGSVACSSQPIGNVFFRALRF